MAGYSGGNSQCDRDEPPSKRLRPCAYGESCYRRNVTHLLEYSHPHLEGLLDIQVDGEELKLPPGFKGKLDSPTVLQQLSALREAGIKRSRSTASTKQGNGSTSVQTPPLQATGHSQKYSPFPTQRLGDRSVENTRPANSSSTKAEGNNPRGHDDLKTDIKTEKQIAQNDKPREEYKTQQPKEHKTQQPNNHKTHQPSHVEKNTNFNEVRASSSNQSANDRRKRASQQSTASDCITVAHPAVANRGKVATKLEAAAPFNFFLTTVLDSKPTHTEALSITFAELLDTSLGQLKSSLQINFMVELDWLLEQYQINFWRKTPITILYGVEDEESMNTKCLPENVTAIRVKPPTAFGHHHTKMSIFYYEDGGVRVVVSTANLIASDWENRSQGLWVSPLCPPLPPNSDTGAGDSPTEFKSDLLRYLINYQQPRLQEWITRIRGADFSAVRVCFIASVPGTHRGPDHERWGHLRLAALLRKHGTVPDPAWPVVAQCSSIGTLGPNPDSWMCGEFLHSLSQGVRGRPILQSPPPFRMIYPSFRNVISSIHGRLGGACLPYSIKTHQKQNWFTTYLFEWKSEKRHRSEAMPHIKTYARMSPCGKQLAWFVLTSANLSKAAWGSLNKTKARSDPGLYMMSYEAGVLFLPKFLTGENVFTLQSVKGKNFPLPYDIPLSRYEPRDKPWVMEYLDGELKNLTSV